MEKSYICFKGAWEFLNCALAIFLFTKHNGRNYEGLSRGWQTSMGVMAAYKSGAQKLIIATRNN